MYTNIQHTVKLKMVLRSKSSDIRGPRRKPYRAQVAPQKARTNRAVPSRGRSLDPHICLPDADPVTAWNNRVKATSVGRRAGAAGIVPREERALL